MRRIEFDAPELGPQISQITPNHFVTRLDRFRFAKIATPKELEAQNACNCVSIQSASRLHLPRVCHTHDTTIRRLTPLSAPRWPSIQNLAAGFSKRSIAQPLAPTHLSQIINYLKASSLQRGLLINFGTKSLEYKRVIWNSP